MSNTDKSSGEKVKILIVDDHPIVRAGFTMLISQQEDMELCGEAETIAEAMTLLREKQPDVLVVDISLKDGSGLELIKRVQARNEMLRILVSSMHDENLFAERAIRAGAMGYITKQVAARNIIEAIRTILGGKMYLSNEIAQRVLHNSMGKKTPDQAPIETLSDRELTVFELIGRGVSTKKIAEQLHLSIKTVETYREKIKDKLGLDDSSELTRHAVQWVLENC